MIHAEAEARPEVIARRLKRGVYRRDVNGALEKRCSHHRCRQYLPADSAFFFARSKSKDGLQHWCKACILNWQREHRTKH